MNQRLGVIVLLCAALACAACGDSTSSDGADVATTTAGDGAAATGDSTSTSTDATTTGSDGAAATGDSSTGDSSTSDSSTGDADGGDSGTGDADGGDSGTGDTDVGDVSTGDADGGDVSTGDADGGDTGSGDTGSGDVSTGDADGGDSGTGDTDGGDASTGDSGTDTGDTGTGDDTCFCDADDQCPEGTTCVDPGPEGNCLEDPGAGACWDDSFCAADQVCEGAIICPCDVTCVAHAPGTCVKLQPMCCGQDADCGSAESCNDTSGQSKGICGPPLPPGQCWRDEHCAGGFECTGAAACPCDGVCAKPDAPGECTPILGDGCCTTDKDCAPDGDCIGGFGPGADVCKTEPLDPGACWEDDDCPGAQTCDGEITCPCGAQCFAPDKPGTCSGETGPCADFTFQKGCGSSAQCDPGEVCEFNGGCNPSTCACDPNSGFPICTADCQPGYCTK